REVRLERVVESFRAEVLAVRGGERAGSRRRAGRRVAADQVVDVLAAVVQEADELVDEPRLADARLALDEDDLSLAGLRLLVERRELRELLVASDERRLARHADAAERACRLDPQRLLSLAPPRAAFALVEDPHDLG